MTSLQNKQPQLIALSAPSGGGKTTLCSRLLNDFPELKLSISCTTRLPRGNEVHGKEYYFLTQEDFLSRIQKNDFVEHVRIYDQYYGTSLQFMNQIFDQNHSVLLDIDVQGALAFKKLYQQRCHTFFIQPPNLDILEQRLRNRKTDSEEAIQKRMKHAHSEIQAAHAFDHILINEDLDRTYLELKKLVLHYLRDLHDFTESNS
jgi:guanylate kinase